METKETLVNRTLESLEGMEKANANPFLYNKVMHRMQTVTESRFVRPAMIRLALAAIAVIICMNVYSLFHYEKAGNASASANNPVRAEYFSYISNLNF